MISLLLLLVQVHLIGAGAESQHELINHQLQLSLEEYGVPEADWAEVVSHIAVKRRLTRMQCSGGNTLRIGCTLCGHSSLNGQRIALVRYMPSQARKVLAHEFKHAIGWVVDADGDFHP